MEGSSPTATNNEAQQMEKRGTSSTTKAQEEAAYERKWKEMYQRLEHFKNEHGHCRVPNRYTDDKALGYWVSTQRKHYRMLVDDQNEKVSLSLERIRMLTELGFEWCCKDPNHKSWSERYDELCAFKEKYGHTIVPMKWKENPRLATWVSAQRQEYKKLQQGVASRLNHSQLQDLKRIGFVWEATRGRQLKKHPSILEQDKDGAAALPTAEVSAIETTQQRNMKPAMLSPRETPPGKEPGLSSANNISINQGRNQALHLPVDAANARDGAVIRTQAAAGNWSVGPRNSRAIISQLLNPINSTHAFRRHLPENNTVTLTPQQHQLQSMLLQMNRQHVNAHPNASGPLSMAFLAEQLAAGTAVQMSNYRPAPAAASEGLNLAAIQAAYSLSLDEIKGLLQQEVLRRVGTGEVMLQNRQHSVPSTPQMNPVWLTVSEEIAAARFTADLPRKPSAHHERPVPDQSPLMQAKGDHSIPPRPSASNPTAEDHDDDTKLPAVGRLPAKKRRI